MRFFANILVPKITKLCFEFEIIWRQNSGEKSANKMLMKLTPGYATENGQWAIQIHTQKRGDEGEVLQNFMLTFIASLNDILY